MRDMGRALVALPGIRAVEHRQRGSFTIEIGSRRRECGNPEGVSCARCDLHAVDSGRQEVGS